MKFIIVSVFFWVIGFSGLSYADSEKDTHEKCFDLNVFGLKLPVPCGFNVTYDEQGAVRLDNLFANEKEHTFLSPTIMKLGKKDQYFEGLMNYKDIGNHLSKCKSFDFIKLKNLNEKGYTIAVIYSDSHYFSVASDSSGFVDNLLLCN